MKSRQIYVQPHILFYVHNILRVKATESNTLCQGWFFSVSTCGSVSVLQWKINQLLMLIQLTTKSTKHAIDDSILWLHKWLTLSYYLYLRQLSFSCRPIGHLILFKRRTTFCAFRVFLNVKKGIYIKRQILLEIIHSCKRQK